jgi:signal transduction histidine kinase
VREQVRQTWRQSLLVLVIAVSAVLLIATLVLRRFIVRPIKQVSHAMSRIASGDLDHRIPVIGEDELSLLAQSFNNLAAELRQRHAGFKAEHNKLATILMSAEEGIVVTDGSSRIVLVNPAAERLLEKSSSRIIDEGCCNCSTTPHGSKRRCRIPASMAPATPSSMARVIWRPMPPRCAARMVACSDTRC